MWASLPLRVKGLVVVAIPLGALIVTVTALFVVESQERWAQAQARHTFEVRNQMRLVLTDMLNAQNGIQAYVLSGRSRSLVPFAQAFTALPRSLAVLEALVGDDPSQLERVRRTRFLTGRQLELLAEVRSLPPGPRQAALVRRSETGLDTLRNQMEAMRRVEEGKLRTRLEEVQRAVRRDLVTFAVSGAVGVGGGVVAILLFTTGIVRRTQRLEENARRLASERPLLDRPPGGDELGRLAASLATANDLLQERKRWLTAIYEASPDMIAVSSADAERIHVSPAVRSILGVDPGALVRGDLIARVHPDDEAEVRRLIAETRSSGRPVRIRTRLRHEEGHWVWVDTWACRMGGEGSEDLLVIGREATAQVEMEEALRTAMREAEAADHAKSRFLSRTSHELRTPLNAILGFAQLLAMGPLDARQREGAEQILRAGNHLLRLMNDLLDTARIEADELQLDIEEVSVDEIVQECTELLTPVAAERGVQVRRGAAAGDPLAVEADRGRLRQILLNLLSNAIKYNVEGGNVTVTTERPAEGWGRISVADGGPGIPKDQLDRLFVPFERLGAPDTVEGTGLGLPLSKRLAEAMGGVLDVDTSPGSGSTFWVDLPTTHRLPAQSPAAPPGTVRVLYIEDNPANARLVEHALGPRTGVEVEVAPNGTAGLHEAIATKPDLILLDLHLPDISGEEVLRRLRSTAATAAIEVVIVSADLEPARRRELLQAGAARCLPKPLDLRALIDLIDDVRRQTNLATSAAGER